jgi:hypothetical protein
VLTTATFDSNMNWAMFGECVLAVFFTQLDGLRNLLSTIQLELGQSGWALVPAVGLLVL